LFFQDAPKTLNQRGGFVPQLRKAEAHDAAEHGAPCLRQLQHNNAFVQAGTAPYQKALLLEPVRKLDNRVMFQAELVAISLIVGRWSLANPDAASSNSYCCACKPSARAASFLRRKKRAR
jgi:hypothetical protein